MALLAMVLKGIVDDKPIADRMDRSEALKGLVEDYKKQLDLDATLPTFTSFTTGVELKNAVALLSAETQLAMLKKYSDCIHGVVVCPPIATEAPHVIEERRQRHWLVKFMSMLAGAVVIIMMSAVVSVVIKSGNASSNASIVSSVMETAGEIFKLIFSTGNRR